jgi:hypothetical protein
MIADLWKVLCMIQNPSSWNQSSRSQVVNLVNLGDLLENHGRLLLVYSDISEIFQLT